jgi:DNA-binding beta-propeller fold protein YncE
MKRAIRAAAALAILIAGLAIVTTEAGAAPKAIANISIGSGAMGVALNGAGTEAYVDTNILGTSELWIVNTTTKKVTSKVNIGLYAQWIRADASGKYVYIANSPTSGNVGSVTVVKTKTHKVVKTIPSPMEPTGVLMSNASHTLYVAGYKKIAVIDTQTNSLKGDIKATCDFGQLVESPRGTTVLAACMNANETVAFSASTDKVLATFKGTVSPRVIAFGRGGTYAYVATGSGDITVIDMKTLKVTSVTRVAATAATALAISPTGHEIFALIYGVGAEEFPLSSSGAAVTSTGAQAGAAMTLKGQPLSTVNVAGATYVFTASHALVATLNYNNPVVANQQGTRAYVASETGSDLTVEALS